MRKACHWLVNLRYFDNTILVIILISSVLLALEDPVVEGSDRNKVRLNCWSVCFSYIIIRFGGSSDTESFFFYFVFFFGREKKFVLPMKPFFSRRC